MSFASIYQCFLIISNTPEQRNSFSRVFGVIFRHFPLIAEFFTFFRFRFSDISGQDPAHFYGFTNDGGFARETTRGLYRSRAEFRNYDTCPRRQKRVGRFFKSDPDQKNRDYISVIPVLFRQSVSRLAPAASVRSCASWRIRPRHPLRARR